jgi:hypothetical protein
MQRCMSPGCMKKMSQMSYRSILFTSFQNFLSTYIVISIYSSGLSWAFPVSCYTCVGRLIYVSSSSLHSSDSSTRSPAIIPCLPNQGVPHVFHPDYAIVSIRLLVSYMPSCLVLAACQAWSFIGDTIISVNRA